MNITEKINEVKFTNLIPDNSFILKELRQEVSDFLNHKKLVPPLQQNNLIEVSTEFLKSNPKYITYRKLIAVLINNFTWQPVVERIHFNRRILLLPQCMKSSAFCKAPVDELGLICQGCGKCALKNIIAKAEEKGYHVIVSEGTGAVSMLLASGKVECVIGVGCLDSLERTFPLTSEQAIPSIALPLLNSNCKDSKIDIDWLNEILDLDKTRLNGHISFESLKHKVNSWFTTKNLISVLDCHDENELIAINWLSLAGKRWRPLIMLNVFESLHSGSKISESSVMKLAIAVECFHKASLVHDDIEDDDSERYGNTTLHEKYGIPVAINIGDLLLGFGYQLIAEANIDPVKTKILVKNASKGHCDLCLGQGKELLSVKNKEILSVEDIVDVFEKKTSPAFEVALQFGVVLAGYSTDLSKIIKQYSKSIGIAYQIKDDLEDFNTEFQNNDIDKFRPSLILSILNEKYSNDFLEFMREKHNSTELIYEFANSNGIIDLAQNYLEKYKNEAYAELDKVEYSHLKIFLTQIIHRMTHLSKK
jgi:geranylgeranyl pyrophosphate synthase